MSYAKVKAAKTGIAGFVFHIITPFDGYLHDTKNRKPVGMWAEQNAGGYLATTFADDQFPTAAALFSSVEAAKKHLVRTLRKRIAFAKRASSHSATKRPKKR